MSGGRAASRNAGITKMVGTGRPRLGGHEDGGKSEEKTEGAEDGDKTR